MKKRTYAEIQAQIEQLQAQAEELKKKEVAGVVERIKEAISFYSLTREDLFPNVGKPAKKAKRTTTAYSDGVNTWSGFGPKPAWLKDALEAGKTLEELKA